MTLKEIAVELHCSLRSVQRYASRGLGGVILTRNLDGGVDDNVFRDWLVATGLEPAPELCPASSLEIAPEPIRGEIPPLPPVEETLAAPDPTVIDLRPQRPDLPLSNVPIPGGSGNWASTETLEQLRIQMEREFYESLVRRA